MNEIGGKDSHDFPVRFGRQEFLFQTIKKWVPFHDPDGMVTMEPIPQTIKPRAKAAADELMAEADTQDGQLRRSYDLDQFDKRRPCLGLPEHLL